MSTATPSFLTDLAARLVALGGSSFPASRVFVDKELPPGGVVLEESTWLRFIEQIAEPYDNDGAVRSMAVQIKHRFDPIQDKAGAAALTRCVAVHDALHKAGPFTGASGAAYLYTMCRTFPRRLEDNYIVWDVLIDFDTPSTT